ncbi:MAG: heavy metal translocating P-type ATPase [Myxococcales bacterium]|nr:heavy metal translocating P-type ATPase [Myxococcales bacterium]
MTSSPPLTPDPAPGAATTPCKHCHAPVAAGSEFCCGGCETVFTALQAGGLDDYYRLRDVDTDALVGVAARPRGGDSYAYLDTEDYRQSHCDALMFATEQGPAPGFEATWAVDGMTCVACAWVIEEVAKKTDGIHEVRVDLMRREVHLRFGEGAKLTDLAGGIGEFGYGVALPGARVDSAAGTRRELVNLAIAGAIAANTMMLTLPYYTGLQAGQYAALFGWFSLGLATISVLVPGRVFFRNAWAAARLGMASLDLPIGLGVAAAWGYSTVQTVLGHWHELYFDSLTVLVFALLVGRFFQTRAVERAVARARLLAATMPELVHIHTETGWQEVAPEAIAVGDRLRLDPGQSLPCQGRLLVGPRTVDLQVTTGEEAPRRIEVGEELPAGCRAVDEALEVEATSPAVAVADDPAPTADGKSPRRVAMLADRMGAVFTLVVITVSALAFVGWASAEGVGEGLRVAITVLIVACPCAIGLATPVTASLTIAAAAKHGVLVREPSVIDRLGRIRVAVFDKTGTLTQGRPEVVAHRWWVDDHASLGGALHDIEVTSRHPVAKGVVRWLETTYGPFTSAEPASVKLLAGEGIEGKARGHYLLALGCTASERRGFVSSERAHAWIEQAERDQHSVVCVWQQAPSGTPVLVLTLALQDALRADGARTIGELAAKGIRPVLLSGDHQRATQGVADRLGIADARGDASPDDKGEQVLALESEGPVIMVGDGYNDVPALRGASLAVTLASGTPGAIAASEVVLHSGGLAGLTRLFDRAAAARRVIHTTLAFAAAYNAIGMALAAAGLITPLLAALLMPLSSGTVVSYAVWASRRTQARLDAAPIVRSTT